MWWLCLRARADALSKLPFVTVSSLAQHILLFPSSSLSSSLLPHSLDLIISFICSRFWWGDTPPPPKESVAAHFISWKSLTFWNRNVVEGLLIATSLKFGYRIIEVWMTYVVLGKQHYRAALYCLCTWFNLKSCTPHTGGGADMLVMTGYDRCSAGNYPRDIS